MCDATSLKCYLLFTALTVCTKHIHFRAKCCKKYLLYSIKKIKIKIVQNSVFLQKTQGAHLSISPRSEAVIIWFIAFSGPVCSSDL